MIHPKGHLLHILREHGVLDKDLHDAAGQIEQAYEEANKDKDLDDLMSPEQRKLLNMGG